MYYSMRKPDGLRSGYCSASLRGITRHELCIVNAAERCRTYMILNFLLTPTQSSLESILLTFQPSSKRRKQRCLDPPVKERRLFGLARRSVVAAT